MVPKTVAMPDVLGARQMIGLAGLDNSDLILELATGLPLVLESARELAAAAAALGNPHERSKAVLAHHAQEEAAKGLMLIDLLRCPKRRQDDRRRLAKSIYDHLSRALYAESCDWHPTTFGELRQCMESARERYYLDGPNDVDWIFLNSAVHKREALLYADRIRLEDGFHWQAAGGPFGSVRQPSSAALRSLEAIAAIGAFGTAALHEIAATWDVLELDDATHWQTIAALNQKTLECFKILGALDECQSADISRGLDWPMPLYTLDLSLKRTDLGELRQRRSAWTP